MDAETHNFAVETTAQIEVLRCALVLLTAETLRRLRAEDRDDVLDRFAATASDVPAGMSLSSPAAAQMFACIAEAIPRHAERFADDVRSALE